MSLNNDFIAPALWLHLANADYTFEKKYANWHTVVVVLATGYTYATKRYTAVTLNYVLWCCLCLFTNVQNVH